MLTAILHSSCREWWMSVHAIPVQREAYDSAELPFGLILFHQQSSAFRQPASDHQPQGWIPHLRRLPVAYFNFSQVDASPSFICCAASCSLALQTLRVRRKCLACAAASTIARAKTYQGSLSGQWVCPRKCFQAGSLPSRLISTVYEFHTIAISPADTSIETVRHGWRTASRLVGSKPSLRRCTVEGYHMSLKLCLGRYVGLLAEEEGGTLSMRTASHYLRTHQPRRPVF